MKVDFKIIISKEYKLKITILNEEGEETIIVEEVTPCIRFNTHTIDICEEGEGAISFMKNWIENPEEYSTYSIQYQNKQFNLLPEVLFAIIINEFKKKVERKIIIKATEIQIPADNEKILKRIKI